MNEKEAEEMAKKMMSAEFDFNDFLKQSQMMKNMGSFGGVANMLPGMAGKLNPQQLNQVQVCNLFRSFPNFGGADAFFVLFGVLTFGVGEVGGFFFNTKRH